MDFPRLTVFLAVARQLNFHRAAETLHLSQPAVSRHIQRLEAELGLALFERRGNRVALTEAGRRLQDYGQRVARLTDEVRRELVELQGLQRGKLRIGASTTPGLYLLPERLAHFRRDHPGIEASLEIGNSAEVSRRVAGGELDLGFVGALPDQGGLQVQAFAEDEVVLITPPGRRFAHPLASASVAAVLAPFAGEPWILREPGSGTREVALAGLARLGVTPAHTMELAGCEAVKRAVAAGLGVGFVSRHAIALEVGHRLVSIVDEPRLRFRRALYLVTRKDARPSPAALAFTAQVLQAVAVPGPGRRSRERP
jgi:DNA-binding transcriptional LysR family regulator